MTTSVIRFTFATPRPDADVRREIISTAAELVQWADGCGVTAVSIDEHHVTGHGWSSNPVLAATMFLARTERLYASIDCALGPLWNPLRLAEDIAFVDAMSGGRLITTVGLGYRPVEYAAMGVSFSQRAELMDRLLGEMLRAWSNLPIVDIDPGSSIGSRSWVQPHPPLFVGGGVRATARRAAHHGLGLSLPDIADYYRELCAQAGTTPAIIMPARVNRGMIFLHEDPEKAWSDLGEHLLWEAATYGGWSPAVARSSMHLPGVHTLDAVRRSGRYRFLTPEELIDEVRESPDYGPIVLHPLVGGMPIDEAWRSVHLLTDKVLPALAETSP
jgi:alkanesulfonate monooxygenase SsuD/methylene tetrahydromethanopterin reductase-like flavin-dependent oxidoreductase (luciferase family)